MNLNLQTFKKNFIQMESSLFSNVTNTFDIQERGPIMLFNLLHVEVVESTAKVIFEDTTFENNTGFASVLLIKQEFVIFVNCLFKNNFAVDHGAAISVVRESGSLHIYNTTVLVTDNTPVSKALTESLAGGFFTEKWLTGYTKLIVHS